MPNRNITEVMGHVGKDPETRVTKTGTSYTKFSIATSNDYQKDGEWIKQPPTWWDCTAWKELGEEVEHTFSKGDAVMVRGKASARSWEGKDGTINTSLEIRVNEVYKPIYAKKEKAGYDDNERPRKRQPNQPDEEFDNFPLDMSSVRDDADADIPF